MRKRGLIFILGGIVSLTLISGVMLSSVSVRAEGDSASTSVTVPSSHCTMETDVSDDVPHTATINNGTYKEDIGTTTFSVFCGDTGGFSVYAIGYSGNELGNTKLLATVGGNLSPVNDIVTGTATSGDASHWAMKAVPVSGTYTPTIESDTNGSFANYHLVPSTYTKIATFNSTTTETIGSSFYTTYRAYISPTQLAGSYQGKVRYTLVHPNDADAPTMPQACEAGKICYFPNASGVVDTMGDQSASANSEVVLWASNFKREGYGFAGWNTEYDYSGTTYGPNETITTPSDLATKGLSLYAVWVKSAGNLQGWTGCSALSIGDVTALTDTRDNDTYAVAKLADGKCWMIENLRLSNVDSNGNPITIDSTNTNNPASGFSLSAPVDPTQTAWCSNNNAACDDQSMLSTNNTSNAVASMTTPTDVNVYGYGNYYNWYSATAGNGLYSTSTNNTSVSGDICPSGWHLPKGGNKSNESNNEYWNLIVTNLNNGTNPADYASSTYPYYTGTPEGSDASKLVRTYPNNFIYSGYVSSSSVSSRGSFGYFWSSTAGSSYYAYYLRFYSTYVYPGTFNYNKYYGRAVRCVSSFGVGS